MAGAANKVEDSMWDIIPTVRAAREFRAGNVGTGFANLAMDAAWLIPAGAVVGGGMLLLRGVRAAQAVRSTSTAMKAGRAVAAAEATAAEAARKLTRLTASSATSPQALAAAEVVADTAKGAAERAVAAAAAAADTAKAAAPAARATGSGFSAGSLLKWGAGLLGIGGATAGVAYEATHWQNFLAVNPFIHHGEDAKWNDFGYQWLGKYFEKSPNDYVYPPEFREAVVQIRADKNKGGNIVPTFGSPPPSPPAEGVPAPKSGNDAVDKALEEMRKTLEQPVGKKHREGNIATLKHLATADDEIPTKLPATNKILNPALANAPSIGMG